MPRIITIPGGVTNLTPTLIDGVFVFETLVNPAFQVGDVKVDGVNVTILPTTNGSGDITLTLTDAEDATAELVTFRDQTSPRVWNDLDFYANVEAVAGDVQPVLDVVNALATELAKVKKVGEAVAHRNTVTNETQTVIETRA